MTTTSHTLLERLHRSEDTAAWNRFVQLYTPLLVAWCRRLGLSDADAADLMQSVFLTLCQRLPEFRYDPNRSFRAWLKTVLMNAWRNRLRNSREVAGNGENGGEPDQVADADPRVALDEAEYRQYLVRRALTVMQRDFETKTWQACWSFVVEGRPAAEVARELEMSENAVYLAKSRVLRHLRTELQGLLD